MNSNEAALYFFIYWLIWPTLILLYIPMAATLSPIYLIGLTWKLFELFIEAAADGEEINERVEEADEDSDVDVDVEWSIILYLVFGTFDNLKTFNICY